MTHYCKHLNACSLGPLRPSERGPHLRALILASPTKAFDEVFTECRTLGQPGVPRIYPQRPALKRCQKLRRPSESLAPWALGGGYGWGDFRGVLGGGRAGGSSERGSRGV